MASLSRPPLGKGVRIFLIVNIAIYVAELILAYAVDFDPLEVANVVHAVALSVPDILSGWVWQVGTHMWVHDPDIFTHILFNMLVLYWFGPTLESRWGTKRFVIRYFIFGMGSAAAILATGLIYWGITGDHQAPTLGASGAIAGLVCSYCLVHWRATLGLFTLRFTGRTLLLVFIGIDVLRLLWGENIAVQGHWGGMVAAAIVMRKGELSPSLLWLQFKRWRLKRRLRLKRGGKSDDKKTNGKGDYLH